MAYSSSLKDAYQAELASIREQGLYKEERYIHSPQSSNIEVEYPTGSALRSVVNLCANNYLGLSSHPEVIEAAHKALDQRGYGMSSVRFICGTQDIHRELEGALSRFLDTEDTILFPSCMDANAGVFEAVLGAEDVIVSDRLVHASIVDGIRLCKAMTDTYKHANMNHLEQKLQEHQDKRARLIVTDGVFSMDGDIAPLDKIFEITKDHEAVLMVDDAHGEGVLGKGGRGIVDHFDLHGKVDIEIGTFSKAFGVMGGVAAGNEKIVEWLHQRGRPFLFSSAMTVPDVAACLAAIDLLEGSTELVDRLWANTDLFKSEMIKMGFDTGKSVTPITPIMLGEAKLAQEFSRNLYNAGVFGMAIGYPTVPRGAARIRVMISAAHSTNDLEKGLDAFQKVGKQLGVIS